MTLDVPSQVRPDIPVQSGPSMPLARRTPMATLPTSIRRRQAAG